MTKSWYVKHRADRKTKEYTKSWLRCNRTGTFVSKITGKRAMKSQGSCKTGCSCPAFITTRRYHATGEVQAEFCLKHVGHRQENAFNRMSKEIRTTIAAKLSQGVSMTSVMDYIRDSMCGPLNRDHLITRADLHNIKQQYNINCMQKASDDADSVLYWVQEMQSEKFNPVLFFKPPISMVWKKKISYWHCKRSSKKKCLKNMLINNMIWRHPRYDGIWLPASHSSCYRWLQRRCTRSVAH